tara:strand:- start:3455 stop:4201 length:747 start_codon:yes stop_codon:yes gene_type:complete
MIVANWKCNGSKEMIQGWLKDYKERYFFSKQKSTFVGIAPPFIYVDYLSRCIDDINLSISLGVQNIDPSDGARTSAVSLGMIKDFNCKFIIIGHSEMRNIFHETNENISAKLDIVENDFNIILCVGESAEENANNQTKNIIEQQLSVLNARHISPSLTVAYEPVWAIGTGNTPEPNQINEIHKFIKDVVQSSTDNNISPRVLYGGSVNEKNASNFFKEEFVDGALIGGASLNGKSFANIVNIYNGKKI